MALENTKQLNSSWEELMKYANYINAYNKKKDDSHNAAMTFALFIEGLNSIVSRATLTAEQIKALEANSVVSETLGYDSPELDKAVNAFKSTLNEKLNSINLSRESSKEALKPFGLTEKEERFYEEMNNPQVLTPFGQPEVVEELKMEEPEVISPIDRELLEDLRLEQGENGMSIPMRRGR